MTKLSTTLKFLRESHNYTQQYVAGILHISQNTYSLFENGQTKVTIDRLQTLAALYEIDVADLFSSDRLPLGEAKSEGLTTPPRSQSEPEVKTTEIQQLCSTVLRLEHEIDRLHSIVERLANTIGTLDENARPEIVGKGLILS